MESLLTAPQLAAVLKVKLKTVYTWAACGRLPSQRVGRSLRFSPTAIRSWLEDQARPAGAYPQGPGRFSGRPASFMDTVK